MGLVANTGPVGGIDEGEGGDLALGDVLSVGIGTASEETRVWEVCSASVEVRVLEETLIRSASGDGGPVRLHRAIRGPSTSLRRRTVALVHLDPGGDGR